MMLLSGSVEPSYSWVLSLEELLTVSGDERDRGRTRRAVRVRRKVKRCGSYGGIAIAEVIRTSISPLHDAGSDPPGSSATITSHRGDGHEEEDERKIS